MKASEHPGVVLTAIRMDGKPGAGLSRCEKCDKFHVMFIASMGLRGVVPSLPEREVVCVNTSAFMGLPCPRALAAKPWLDALKEATR